VLVPQLSGEATGTASALLSGRRMSPVFQARVLENGADEC
jgi:hypothetical protein